jgi:hypothetical protein
VCSSGYKHISNSKMSLSTLLMSIYINETTIEALNLSTKIRLASVKDVALGLEVLVDLLQRITESRATPHVHKTLCEITKAIKLVTNELLHKRVLTFHTEAPRYNPEVLKFFEREAEISSDDDNEDDDDGEDGPSDIAKKDYYIHPEMRDFIVDSETDDDNNTFETNNVEDSDDDKIVIRHKKRKIINDEDET